MSATPRETYPLSWPEGWTRTRPQNQRKMAAWKKTANQYRDALAKELTRMESPSFVISSNVPLNQRGGMTFGIEPRDVGVAVYFARKIEEDFRWQDVLSLKDPYPSEAQVQDAYRRLAQIHHPDKGGDLAMFQEVTRQRDNALRWLNRSTQDLPYVIACDTFAEVRLNMAAIVMTIRAIRQIERCGTSSLLERAFKGFSALPAQGESSAAVNS